MFKTEIKLLPLQCIELKSNWHLHNCYLVVVKSCNTVIIVNNCYPTIMVKSYYPTIIVKSYYPTIIEKRCLLPYHFFLSG